MIQASQHRDDLANAVESLGWVVAASRRRAGVAQVTLVDLRGGPVGAATKGPPSDPSSTLYVYSVDDVAALPALARGGARHFLRSPFSSTELDAHLVAAFGGEAKMTLSRHRDPLTGLATASALRSWIGSHLGSGAVTLLVVNLIRFDAINAAMGRDAGDVALRAVARRIEPLATELPGVEHMLARMPGAEFTLGIHGPIAVERLQLLAEAIVEAVGRPVPLREGRMQLGCRVAIVAQRTSERGANSLLRRSSLALGEIREGKAANIRFMLEGEPSASELTGALHADLRAALSKDEIDVLFQPQVGVSSGRIEGVEALARWRHPTRGEIGAATLFVVAEQSDYVIELSQHIQRRALRMAAAWPAALAQLRLSLNVTAQELSRNRFARDFLAIVDESGFARSRLTAELTEGSAMQDLDIAAKSLAQLRASGCRVAIDDFGTGYSSLAWLKALPADYLKLDKGLAGDILGGERDTVVLRGVIAMARSLGLSVIAEGVETDAQLTLLAREGCSLYQGFLCSPATDKHGLIRLVRERN